MSLEHPFINEESEGKWNSGLKALVKLERLGDKCSIDTNLLFGLVHKCCVTPKCKCTDVGNNTKCRDIDLW
jgi:hypothetical protein